MAFSHNQRRITLAALLALTLAATAWVSKKDDPPENLTPSSPYRQETARPASSQRANGIESLRLDKLERPLMRADNSNPFASKSWYVPPPPPKAQPAPPPSAPPLPFVYMGKLIDEGQVIVFLSKQDRSFAVKLGDIIESSYRADEIGPTTLTLTYLPMKIKQTLAIGDRN